MSEGQRRPGSLAGLHLRGSLARVVQGIWAHGGQATEEHVPEISRLEGNLPLKAAMLLFDDWRLPPQLLPLLRTIAAAEDDRMRRWLVDAVCRHEPEFSPNHFVDLLPLVQDSPDILSLLTDRATGEFWRNPDTREQWESVLPSGAWTAWCRSIGSTAATPERWQITDKDIIWKLSAIEGAGEKYCDAVAAIVTSRQAPRPVIEAAVRAQFRMDPRAADAVRSHLADLLASHVVSDAWIAASILGTGSNQCRGA